MTEQAPSRVPPVTKAVIPAAGLGTRFLPATKAQPKEMLPVVDKPAIQYVVEEAVAAGLRDLLVVTGRGKRSIEDHFDRSYELEHSLEESGRFAELGRIRSIAEMANIHYVRQAAPRGLGDAVACAAAHVGNAPFAVLLADDLMDPAAGVLAAMLSAYERTGASVVALMEVPAEDIPLYGCVAFDATGHDGLLRLTRVVEKPKPQDAPSRFAVMGRYVFTPGIFESLGRTGPGRGGEVQLSDAIQDLISAEPVYGYPFTKGRFDIGNKLDYLRATVEMALARPDLAGPFRRVLTEILREHGIVPVGGEGAGRR